MLVQEYISASPAQKTPLPRIQVPTPHAVWVGKNPVPNHTPLDRLLADYAGLDRYKKSRLTPDQRQSLVYYHLELDLKNWTQREPSSSVRATQWFADLIALETFLVLERRWPRQNNRADREEFTEEEWRLAIWVRTQRIAIDQGRRCDYQIRRLDCVEGFQQHPLEDRWNRRLHEYRRFTLVHKRAPLLRSDDLGERSLAAWAAKQRLAYRSGTLARHRVDAATHLKHWTWG